MPVKTGDELDLGNGKKLVFVEAPMLHWPDSMFSYMTGDAILFSNDAFGQHLATEQLYNDLVDQDELYDECDQVLREHPHALLSPGEGQDRARSCRLKLPVEHDRHEPRRDLAGQPHADRAQVPGVVPGLPGRPRSPSSTTPCGRAPGPWPTSIARAINEASPSTTVVSHCLSKFDKNDALTDVFRSKAILVGSPDHQQGHPDRRRRASWRRSRASGSRARRRRPSAATAGPESP
ncbi:MAG: hypothetical protein MZU95_15510 [Desulfomicrobium escambiense]|nr:hypothetical protein [Desulfomicrobium escambiense]